MPKSIEELNDENRIRELTGISQEIIVPLTPEQLTELDTKDASVRKNEKTVHFVITSLIIGILLFLMLTGTKS